MPRDQRLYLDDMLDAIARVQTYTRAMSFADFANDPKTQDAVVRNLEVIGEAANRLPEAVRLSAPQVEWRKLIGLRSALAF